LIKSKINEYYLFEKWRSIFKINKKYYKLIAKESTVKEKCKEALVCEKNLKKEKSS